MNKHNNYVCLNTITRRTLNLLTVCGFILLIVIARFACCSFPRHSLRGEIESAEEQMSPLNNDIKDISIGRRRMLGKGRCWAKSIAYDNLT